MIIKRLFASDKTASPLHRLFFAAKADIPDANGKAVEGGRYGSRLLKMGKAEQYERMQIVMGAQTAPKRPIKTITISILQSLKHLNLSMAYKKKLASYRVDQLGKQLLPLIAKSMAKSDLSVGDGKRS